MKLGRRLAKGLNPIRTELLRHACQSNQQEQTFKKPLKFNNVKCLGHNYLLTHFLFFISNDCVVGVLLKQFIQVNVEFLFC